MDSPANYKTAGLLILIAGALNLTIAAGLGLFFAAYGLMTYGVCCVCCALPIAQIGFGVLEVVTGLNMMNGRPVHNAQTVSILGIVVGALLGGGVTMVPEIIALMLLQDEKVKGWLRDQEPLLEE